MNKKITSFRICSKECSPCYVENRRGVLTIEAALSIPVFLIAMLTLTYLINIYFVYEKISMAACEEAKYISVKSFDDKAYGVGGIQANIEASLGEDFLNSMLVGGKSNGLDFSGSDLSDKEISVISIKYRVKIPYAMPLINELSFEVRFITHNWVGYINGLNGFNDIYEYVYITENGSVYHRSRECTHIRLRISSVSGNEVKKLRNTSGGKYKKCEYCHPKLSDKRLYITEDGDRYHSTLSCSGLKRTIRKVRLSDLNGVKPCTRCGY